ncbi:MAG: FAD:protein FMN transferase [Rhodanobacter sp.]|jgi:thiamine biosynthesis lipoprotein|nr:FAD:protein FMN transferase [Rhodanobacter sp.]
MPKTSSELSRITLHGPAMGTRWSASLDTGSASDVNALREALAAVVEQVDQQMSPWKPDSDLARLNRAPTGQWLPLPTEILEVLTRAQEICRLSGGAFDPAVGGLVDAWGFGATRDTPDPAAIRAARATGVHPIHPCLELDWVACCVRKHAPMQLDLCGIAKGYAVDRMADVLRRHGVSHALASVDGELRALGRQADGRPWSVAIESPQRGRRTVHGVIELDGLAVATSGDYRRWVQVGDVHLSHTMDGRRVTPVNNAIASVTVLAADCMSADAWATALLVTGHEEGLALAQRMGLDVLFLLRCAEGLVEMGRGRFDTVTKPLDTPKI